MNADALLHALHARAYGLNAGRWDYVFSLIKHLGSTRSVPVPPRRELGMDVDAMLAYAEELVRVCRLRGAEAIGGTASFSPDVSNPQPALDAVITDKQREASQGFTAAWAGLPCLLDAVRQGLSQQEPGKEVQVKVWLAGHARRPAEARSGRSGREDRGNRRGTDLQRRNGGRLGSARLSGRGGRARSPERTGPHRLGGVRDGHAGAGARRRDHVSGHAAEQFPPGADPRALRGKSPAG